jgi:hypothetical protein
MAGSDRRSSVSHASTPQAIGEFWDSHSLDDSPMVREVDFEVQARRRHRVTLDPDLYEQVETEARIRGVSPETLANRWLTEKVASEGQPRTIGRHRRSARRPNKRIQPTRKKRARG